MSIGYAGPDRQLDFEVLSQAPAERGRRCCCETWSCKASFFDSMQPADMQLSGDEPPLLLQRATCKQASKQRRLASLVAHLVLLHGKAEQDKGRPSVVRLLYLRQAKHQLHHHSSAAWGASAIYESLRVAVWLAKPHGPACLQPNPRLSEWHLWGTLGSAWARLWMYLRYLLNYERCWVVRVRKGSQGTGSSLVGVG
jgi:hypothetical protein